MNQLPNWKDVKVFFRTSWKTIMISMIGFLILFASALWYSAASQDDLTAQQQELTLNELGQPGISQETYEKLKKDEVSFSFYVENEDGTAFMNYNLLKNYLLSPEVLPQIKEGLKLTYRVPDFFVINISRDTTEALHISIGTGKHSENMLLAQRLYDMFENKEVEIFEGKGVYTLTEPNKIDVEGIDATTETSELQPATTNYLVFAGLGIIVAFVFGVFVAMLQMLIKKEYTNPSIAHFKEIDKIVNLGHLHQDSTLDEALRHSIVHPQISGNKLILDQSGLNNLVLDDTRYIFAASLLSIPEEVKFDEVIMIVKGNVTTKNWLKDQQVLLKNYSVPLKIILV